MPLSIRARRRAAVLATAALTLVAAAPAHAEVETQNACRYSADGIWRNIQIAASGRPDRARAVAGERVSVTTSLEARLLPAWLTEAGVEWGFFGAGHNEVPVKLWFALEARNTVERVQLATAELTLTTHIVLNPDGTLDHARSTPLPTRVAAPDFTTTWTAKGGRIDVRQAAGGSLGRIPAGPDGAPVTVTGSAAIGIQLGSAFLRLDCEPGTAPENDGTQQGMRTRYQAVPFTSISVPGYTCINALGAQYDARQEIASYDLDLAHAGAPQTASAGAPLTLGSTRLSLDVPSEELLEAYRWTSAAGALIERPGASSRPLHAAVTIRATNTVEGTRTVRATGAWTLHVDQPEGADRRDPRVRLLDPDDPARELGDYARAAVTLPATTWTPTGAGDVQFSVVAAGASAPVDVVGAGTPLGAVPYTVAPYGGIFVRAETDLYGANLDCVSGQLEVTDPSVPFSLLGRGPAPDAGSAGRYTITPREPDAFYVAPLAAVIAPPEWTDPPTPTPVAPATPTPTPVPTATPAGKLTLRSTGARIKRGAVQLVLENTTASVARGTITVKTASRVRLRGARKVRTVTRRVSYRLPANSRRTVRATLSRDGKALLQRGRVRIRVTVKPTSGPALRRTAWLRR